MKMKNLFLSIIFGFIRTPAFVFSVVTGGVTYLITIVGMVVLVLVEKTLQFINPIITNAFLCFAVLGWIFGGSVTLIEETKPFFEQQTVLPMPLPMILVDNFNNRRSHVVDQFVSRRDLYPVKFSKNKKISNWRFQAASMRPPEWSNYQLWHMLYLLLISSRLGVFFVYISNKLLSRLMV